MKKEVLISLKSTQELPDGEKDGFELITKGNYYLKNGKYYIVYKESEITGFEDTTTTLKVDPSVPHRVTLTRNGNFNSKICFSQGKRFVTQYETPYGSFSMGFFSSNVYVDLNENGGEIKLDYLMDFNNEQSTVTDLSLNIKKIVG